MDSCGLIHGLTQACNAESREDIGDLIVLNLNPIVEGPVRKLFSDALQHSGRNTRMRILERLRLSVRPGKGGLRMLREDDARKQLPGSCTNLTPVLTEMKDFNTWAVNLLINVLKAGGLRSAVLDVFHQYVSAFLW
jgi:hypothetical protein